MKKKIDILMATYNGEIYIKEQIDSIIKQTYTNWILLVRDDDSNDHTKKIIYDYAKKDSRIKIIEDSKGNLGFVKNFEELLKYSTSDFLMFSDQDDVWFDNKIERLYERISRENETKAVLVHCNSSICDSNLNVLKKKFIKSTKTKKINYFFNFVVQGSSTIINKKMKDTALPFSKEVYIHDRYLDLLSEFLGKKEFINEPLMYYRQHQNNQIGSRTDVVNKVLHKRYFDSRDRELIIKLYENYQKDMTQEKKYYIEKYLEITNTKINRLKRLYLTHKNKIYMNIKKQIFLLLKG